MASPREQCCWWNHTAVSANCGCACHHPPWRESLTPSADLSACRDEDPTWFTTLAACYDPPEYQHPEDDDG